MTGRCSRCDRLKATVEQWQADTCPECGAAWGDNPCWCSERVCWGATDCREVDWRARCLAAEQERDEARRERDVWRKLAESYEIFAQGPTGSAPWGRPDGDPYEELKLLEKAGLVKPDGGNDDAT